MLSLGDGMDQENDGNDTERRYNDAGKSEGHLFADTDEWRIHEQGPEAGTSETVDLADSSPNIPSVVEWYSSLLQFRVLMAVPVVSMI
jgi:hypothetical protein